jgi:hypothetical protein
MQSTSFPLTTAIENATRRTLNEHGPSAFIATREAAIFHEVGHAIIGVHEGLAIRHISIYSRAVPNCGLMWGGGCSVAGPATCRTGPDTTADDDLHRARFLIGGLAAEAAMQMDTPGSSLDDLVMSQVFGGNAATKLADPVVLSALSDGPEYDAFLHQFWDKHVWRVAIRILYVNPEVFFQLAEQLREREKVNGGTLRNMLAQIRRITPCQK